uniref:Small integral membrane protein 1 n=1 Tax=Astyanax mexicanus TaxID=7994 RepID=A0A8B9GQI1_ASTMX
YTANDLGSWFSRSRFFESFLYCRMYNKLCTGQLGIAVRVAGSLAVMAAMYILGYITGYYVHKC